MNRLSESLTACARKIETQHVRHDCDAGVLLVQIDQMARINNSAGTATGDSVLDEIGRRLENFAGDEFGRGSHVDRLDGPRFLIVPAAALSLGALRAQGVLRPFQQGVGQIIIEARLDNEDAGGIAQDWSSPSMSRQPTMRRP